MGHTVSLLHYVHVLIIVVAIDLKLASTDHICCTYLSRLTSSAVMIGKNNVPGCSTNNAVQLLMLKVNVHHASEVSCCEQPSIYVRIPSLYHGYRLIELTP